MKKLWAYLNNKKTYIGVAITAGTQPMFDLIDQPFTIWHQAVPACFPQVQATILWIGAVFVTVGGIHKMIKAKIEATPAG